MPAATTTYSADSGDATDLLEALVTDISPIGAFRDRFLEE